MGIFYVFGKLRLMYSGLVSSIYLCSVIAAVVIELVGVVGAENGSRARWGA